MTSSRTMESASSSIIASKHSHNETEALLHAASASSAWSGLSTSATAAIIVGAFLLFAGLLSAIIIPLVWSYKRGSGKKQDSLQLQPQITSALKLEHRDIRPTLTPANSMTPFTFPTLSKSIPAEHSASHFGQHSSTVSLLTPHQVHSPLDSNTPARNSALGSLPQLHIPHQVMYHGGGPKPVNGGDNVIYSATEARDYGNVR